MGGVGGLFPAFVPMSQLPTSLGLSLHQTAQAMLEGAPGDLAVTVNGMRIPLGHLPQMQAGQEVMLEVVQQGGAFLLRVSPKGQQSAGHPEGAGASQASRITPQTAAAILRTGKQPISDIQAQTRSAYEPLVTPSKDGSSVKRPNSSLPGQTGSAMESGTPASAAAKDGSTPAVRTGPAVSSSSSADMMSTPSQHSPGELGDVVTRLAASLGMSERAGDLMALLPKHIALPESAVRVLLPLLAMRGSLGPDLDAVQTLVSRAIAAEAISRDMGEAMLRILNQVLPQHAEDLRSTLEQMLQRTTVSTEAQLLRIAVESGEATERLTELHASLRSQITSLRQNGDFLRFLAGQGESARFETAVDQILERLTGVEVQNLRGTAHTYHFAELAFPPGAPIEQAQIHFFEGSSGNKSRRFGANHASIVFDLETSGLGELWINLSIRADQCTCLFRVRRSDALTAIEAESDVLAVKLADAGYPGAQIRATLWDGDRIRETARLMQQFSGINVSG